VPLFVDVVVVVVVVVVVDVHRDFSRF